MGFFLKIQKGRTIVVVIQWAYYFKYSIIGRTTVGDIQWDYYFGASYD